MRHAPRLIAVLLLANMLAGCSLLPAQAPQPQLHDFGPLPPPGGGSGAPTRVDHVTAPAWIDDGAIHYRLLYADPTNLRSYAEQRWAAAPSDMLGLRLQSLLQGGGTSAASAPPLRLLKVDLLEFEQDFPGARQAEVKLVVQATLRTALDGRLLGQKQVTVSAPSTPDAHGAVDDLSKVAQQAAQQIAAWCGEIGQDGKSMTAD